MDGDRIDAWLSGTILEYTDLSRELLKNIPSKKNFITKGFASLGIDSHSAFESQALRELKSRYCNTKSCYICKNRFFSIHS